MGQRDQCQYEGASQAPSTSQTGHIGQGQSVGRDRESGISVILLMVDLRVVDILCVDVILDMDELTTIRLSVNGDLSWVVIPDTVLELGEVTYARGWMRVCVKFRDEIFFKEGRM